jgi:predicted component of type VI protein secretion system
MTTPPTAAQLLGGNAKAVKFANIEGFIVGTPTVRQVTKSDGSPDFFKSGDPKWQILATLQTNLPREDEEDDGQRTLYIKSYMFTAVKQAIAKVGAQELEDGGYLRVVYTQDGPKAQAMLSAPKLYDAVYQRPSAEQLVQQQLGGQAVPTQPVQPQYVQSAPQQPVYAQQPAQPAPQAAPAPQTAHASTAPQAQPVQPDAAAIQAIIAAGLDPKKVYPGYQG